MIYFIILLPLIVLGVYGAAYYFLIAGDWSGDGH